jgi:hypothetical protein
LHVLVQIKTWLECVGSLGCYVYDLGFLWRTYANLVIPLSLPYAIKGDGLRR